MYHRQALGSIGRGRTAVALPRLPATEMGTRAPTPLLSPTPIWAGVLGRRTGLGVPVGMGGTGLPVHLSRPPLHYRCYRSGSTRGRDESKLKESFRSSLAPPLLWSESQRVWKQSFQSKLQKLSNIEIKDSLRKTLEQLKATKRNIKNYIPMVIAVAKEVYLFIKELLQAIIDFTVACGFEAFNHAKEGFKDEVRKFYFYGVLAGLVWACHHLGLFKGLLESSHGNPEFDKIMEQVSRDAQGFPVKVELAVVALRFLHQLVTEARDILIELRKIAKNAELVKSMTEHEVKALRSRIEHFEIKVQVLELALSRFEDEVKLLKQRLEAKPKIEEQPKSKQEQPKSEQVSEQV